MVKVLAFSALLAGALAGCAAVPQQQNSLDPCAREPGGYECQIERYQRAPD